MNVQKLVVMRGAAVAAFHLPYGKHEAFFLYLAVAYARLPAQSAAGAFKKVNVFGVIHYAHGVGFAVGDIMGEPDFGKGFFHGRYP